MISGETPSWEDSQRQSIANDPSLLKSFQNLKYVNVALLVLLVYDYCLTFNLETTRIWSLRWRLPKYLFMINRYFLPPLFFFEGFTNVVRVGQSICEARSFTPIPALPAIMMVELMLILRVLALYENSKYMARYIVLQFFVQTVAFVAITVTVVPNTRSIAGQDVFTGCLLAIPEWAWLVWLEPLVIEIILVILVVYKCRKYGEFSPTTKIIARDSIVYFVSITVILTFDLFYARRHLLLGTALTLPTSILSCIAGARLSMNIRGINVDQAISTLAQEGRAVPTLVFRGPQSITYDPGPEGLSSDIIDEEPQGMSLQDDEGGDQVIELDQAIQLDKMYGA